MAMKYVSKWERRVYLGQESKGSGLRYVPTDHFPGAHRGGWNVIEGRRSSPRRVLLECVVKKSVLGFLSRGPDDPRKGKWAMLDMKSWMLCLLASSPEYIDGIPSNYIAMAWPRDDSFHGSSTRVSARVSDLVDREFISLAQIHAASLRSDRFDVRPIEGAHGMVEVAEELFPKDPQASYWVSCVYSEPSLYGIMWPDDYSPKGPPGPGGQLPQVLAYMHAVLSDAAKGGGSGEKADSIIQSQIDSAVSSLGTTRRLGDGNVSAVTVALSSLCHSGQHGSFGLADVLSYLRRSTGWTLPEKPWGSLPELYGSECWMSISERPGSDGLEG